MSGRPISKSIPRVDAAEKASGRTLYIADVPYKDALTARFYRSDFTRGRIKKITYPKIPEGYHIVDFRDVPGLNQVPLIKMDWPAFAEEEIRYKGQIILIAAGPDPCILNEILDGIRVKYEEEIPALTLEDSLSLKGGPIHGENNLYAELSLRKGNPEKAFAEAADVVEGTYRTGFQEQLYMEPQGLVVWPEENGTKTVVHGSLQCPFYVKHAVEAVMGENHKVRVIQAPVGGGFGGKEDYPEIMAAPLAVAAQKIGKPLRCIFDRTEDMAWTSKRHPSEITIKTAHRPDGAISGIDISILLDGGAYESYTLIVLQRAMFTSTGVYNFPNAAVHGRGAATNTVPSGAFRGFGAPQAIYAIEMHMEKVSRFLGREPLEVKRPLFLKQGDPTITGGTMHGKIILEALIEKGEEMSGYAEKRKKFRDVPYRGIGMSLFCHGCGFTGDGEQRIIKGRVKIQKDEHDAVSILTASVDMGQGPQTTFRKVVGSVLGIDPVSIRFVVPDTDAVPDSGPTVASRTMMIVGFLLQEAAKKLKAEWIPGKAQETEAGYQMPPGLKWDQSSLSGDAYASFGWGVNIVEVEVDPVTMEVSVPGVWAVYDVGVPIDQRVVHGQIQGGMSQALGYAYLEKLEVDEQGEFKQRTMADYIIPTTLDFPSTQSHTIDNPYEYGPFGAKGMGEIVHDGGHAAFAAAVEQAIGKGCPSIPLSPERLMEIVSL